MGHVRGLAHLASGSLLITCVLTATPATAQGVGSITGSITDPSGAVVPGATVSVVESGTGLSRTAISDDRGQYAVPALRPSEYKLTVELSGFRPFSRGAIVLLADQSLVIDVRLEIGTSAENVTVEGGAPLVDTSTPTVKEVVEHERMIELPLNGRSAAELINLVAGASGAQPTVLASQSSLPGSVSPTINGSRTNQTSYLLDGADYVDQYYNTNVPFPFPDAVQEFSVQTSNYSARYGGSAGGVVNVITKSGANRLNGDAFEFLRNAALNARGFFDREKDQLRRNQFGGTVGGPVAVRGLYNGSGRTFFFVGYQGTRLRNVATRNAFVPTAANLNGDFSALLDPSNPANSFHRVIHIIDPATGQPFAGNQIKTSRFDPASLALTHYLPQADGTGQVFFRSPTAQDIDEVIARVDHSLSASDRLAGRFFSDHVALRPQFDPHNILVYALGYDIPVRNLLVEETHIFRANLLNESRVAYSTVPVDKIAPSDSPNPSDFGVTGIWEPPHKVIQNIGVNGFFSVSGGAVGSFNSSSLSWSDDVSWVKGRHNVLFGLGVEHARVDLSDSFLAPGSYTFTSDMTNSALASFLLGRLRTFTQGAGEFKNNENWFTSFYIQDSFRKTSRLTLSIGLRYEPYQPWNETKGRVEQFRPADYYAGKTSAMFTNAPPGLFFPGDAGVPPRGTTGDYNNFAPRAGFAYDLTGDGRMSVRGGAGIFYDSRTAGVINNRFVDITPFSTQVTLTDPQGPFSNPYLGVANPFPATFPPPRDVPFTRPVLVVTYDPSSKFIVPETYNWNAVLERQLMWHSMVQVAYVGSRSYHNKETIQLNPAQYILGSTLGTDARRIFQGYGSISMLGMDTNASYDALQITAQRRGGHNVSLTAAYTLARKIDDFPVGGNNNDIGADSASTLPWNQPGRHDFDRGPTGRRHRFVGSYVWLLPQLSPQSPLVRGILGDWQLSGVVTLQSGDPYTVTAGRDQSQTGLGQDRGVQVGPARGPGACGTRIPCVDWLNPLSFQLPAVGTFGAIRKGSLVGPGSFTWDMGLFKNFSVHGRGKLQFRAEFFNVFNHTNFNNPNSSFSAAAFGAIDGAGGPRIGQLALKIQF